LISFRTGFPKTVLKRTNCIRGRSFIIAKPPKANRGGDAFISIAIFRVRYAETDQMGVVCYSNYFIWMELGGAEYFRANRRPP
jgi:hypothetical protein